jgi:hypothetical protein
MGLIEEVPNIPYSSPKLKMYKVLTTTNQQETHNEASIR